MVKNQTSKIIYSTHIAPATGLVVIYKILHRMSFILSIRFSTVKTLFSSVRLSINYTGGLEFSIEPIFFAILTDHKAFPFELEDIISIY
jgi:hypothetical protein